MSCVRVASRRTNHTLIALKAAVVVAHLMKFVDEHKPLPYAEKARPGDDLEWAAWILEGDVWDSRHDFSYEERRFIGAILPDIAKPPAEYRDLLLREGRKGRTASWQRRAADILVEYFNQIQYLANAAEIQDEMR